MILTVTLNPCLTRPSVDCGGRYPFGPDHVDTHIAGGVPTSSIIRPLATRWCICGAGGGIQAAGGAVVGRQRMHGAKLLSGAGADPHRHHRAGAGKLRAGTSLCSQFRLG